MNSRTGYLVWFAAPLIVLAVTAYLTNIAKAQEMGEHGNGRIVRELGRSVHRNLGCSSCHGEMSWETGGPINPTAACGRCHQKESNAMRRDAHWDAARVGKRKAPSCVSCHGSHGIQSRRNPRSRTHATHVPDLCGSCHSDQLLSYGKGIHGVALSVKENVRTATCTSCHAAHGVFPSDVPISSVHRSEVATTCGVCHIKATVEYNRSVHSAAVVKGDPHAATCVDCHGSHVIWSKTAPQSPISVLRLAGETCGRCHEAVRLTKMHGLSASVVSDYGESFHGLEGSLGNRRAANCASCHGFHEIRASSDPLSSTHPANLVTTCGKCHVGAAPGFASGGVHHLPRTFGHRLVDYIRTTYAMMIVMIIGLMVLHNGIDLFGRLKSRRTAKIGAGDGGRMHLRFTLNERMQHWALAGSFIVLALTGFALKFGWRVAWVSGETDSVLRATGHRVAAVIFMALALYHLGYLIFSPRGRQTIRDMLPRLNSLANMVCCAASCMCMGPPSKADWRDLIQNIKYRLGLSSEPPLFGRFSYAEKMEYLALVWGAVVMIGTGLALWLVVPFLNRFPYWAYELATTVHYYEAILATVAIVVWHFYFTIFNPDVFPMSKAMITGKLTREQMEHEHPLELTTLEQAEASKEDQCHPGQGSKS